MSYNSGASVAYGLNTVETLRQKRRAVGDALQRADDHRPDAASTCSSRRRPATKCSRPAPISAPTTSRGERSISHCGPGRRAAPKPRLPAPLATACARATPIPGPSNGFTPLFQAFNLPIYGINQQPLWYGGPPAFPAEGPSVVALGWEGYSLGFTDFAVAPVIGAYHLYAAVPPAYDTPQNPTPSPGPNGTPTPAPGIFAAGAQLTSLTPLPQFSIPRLSTRRKRRRNGKAARSGGGDRGDGEVRTLKNSGNPSPRAWRRIPATAIIR